MIAQTVDSRCQAIEDASVTSAVQPAAVRSRPRLTWTDTTGPHTVDVEEACTAGSAGQCAIVIADRAVSRLHLDLTPRDDGLWVRDLESRNGTYLAATKIECARAPSGSTIHIGNTDIGVSYDAPRAPEGLWPETTFGPLVACSAVMREVFAKVAALADSDVSLILLGEAGTGKKALARTLHDLARRERPFTVLACAALAEGATGLARLEETLVAAEDGTLVLDEPSELRMECQNLLASRAISARIVSTTARDLRVLVNQNAFRDDLYFRLAGATVGVPPLRQRTADIEALLHAFLGDHPDVVTPALVAEANALAWTGNVRELELYAGTLRTRDVPPSSWGQNALGGETVEVPGVEFSELMPPSIFPGKGGAALLPPGLEPWFETGFKDFRERWIELGEREYLRRLLLRTNRSSSAASREAGLERTYLYRLIKKHGV